MIPIFRLSTGAINDHVRSAINYMICAISHVSVSRIRTRYASWRVNVRSRFILH